MTRSLHRLHRRSSLGFVALALLVSACGGASRNTHDDKPKTKTRLAPENPDKKQLGPARYVLTEGVGVSFDEAGKPSPLPHREAAIVSGKRLLLEGGVVIGTAQGPESLLGFRSIPARLGGGLLVWSDSRTYHADTFLGDLRPIADIAAEGGARPWFRTIALRTDLGLLELDPKTLTVRRTDLASFAEVLAVDDQRGARLDTLGRLSISVDGGKTFRDVTAERGSHFFGLDEGESGRLLFSAGYGRAPTLSLDKAGVLAPFAPTNQDEYGWATPVLPFEDTAPPSRTLAPTDLANAVFAGVRLAGGRALVVRDQHLRLLALATGELVDDAPLFSVNENLARCQPAVLGDEVRLVCTHAYGAHVLALLGPPSSPRLEATFFEPSNFIGGLGKRFAFNGRCGANPPSVSDFRGLPVEQDPNAPALPPPEEPAASDEPDTPPRDEAFVCVRNDDGTWIEHKLTGDPALQLYRFLPGKNGNATALVFGKKKDKEPLYEGVTVVRLDVHDPKLKHVSFPALPATQEEAPYRSIDADYWLDENDNSIHGWVLVAGEQNNDENTNAGREDDGEEEERELIPQGRAGRMLPVASRSVGGPAAGIHIGVDGSIEVYPAPKGTVEVIRGGLYAIARAEGDEGPIWYESTSGGQTWTPIEASPTGDFIAGYSETAVQGCSALGCALGDGIVRLGWTSPPPTPRKQPGEQDDPAPAANPAFARTSPISLRCEVKTDGKEADEKQTKEHNTPITLRLPNTTEVGEVRAGSFVASVYTPFEPKKARKISMKAPGVTRVAGEIVPVLLAEGTSPVGLYVRAEQQRFDLGLSEPGKEPIPFAYDRRITVAAELGQGNLALLDGDEGALKLVRGSVIRHLMRFDRVPDVSRARLTLARAVNKGTKLALVSVSSASGDLQLGDIDLAAATVTPLRPVGSLQNLAIAPACQADASAYRLLVDVLVDVHQTRNGEDEDFPYQSGLALIAVSSGKPCLEALEVRLSDAGASLVTRFTTGGAALLRTPGKAEAATCAIAKVP